MMAKWVLIEVVETMTVELVNLDLVQRVRMGRDGVARLVFGAMPGGFDELRVTGAVEEVWAMLRGAAEAAPAIRPPDATLVPAADPADRRPRDRSRRATPRPSDPGSQSGSTT